MAIVLAGWFTLMYGDGGHYLLRGESRRVLVSLVTDKELPSAVGGWVKLTMTAECEQVFAIFDDRALRAETKLLCQARSFQELPCHRPTIIGGRVYCE